MIIQSHWVKCNTCHELVLAREHKGPVCARPPLVVAGLFTSCYRQKQKLFSSCFLCNFVDACSKKMSPRSEFESEVSEISPNFTRAVLRCAVVLWPIARFTDIFFLLIHKGWTQGMGRNEGGKRHKKSEILGFRVYQDWRRRRETAKCEGDNWRGHNWEIAWNLPCVRQNRNPMA
jgi:hypothetical protein